MQINKESEEFLDIICNEIKYKPVRKSISDEIKNHIEEAKEEYILDGLGEDIAEQKAILNMGNPIDIGTALNKIHKPKLDLKLLCIVGIMLVIGALVTYSLTNSLYNTITESGNWFIRNIIFVTAGIIFGTLIYFFDYTKLKKKSFIVYLSSTLICIFAMFMGTTLNSNSYINIPLLNVSILTATLIVPLYIISFAGFINNFDLNKKNDIVLLSILSIISLIVVNYCNSIIYLTVLFASYASILFIEIFKTNKYSKKYKLVVGSMFGMLGLIVFSLFVFTGSPYRIEVAKTIVNPNNDPYFINYRLSFRRDILNNSQFLGSANVEGNLLENISTKDLVYGLQDAKETEVFSYIIGQYGTLIGAIVIFCILLLVIKIIINARNIKDLYGKYIIIGFATMIIIQSALNILSNLCLIIPNSAVLPLISYSGFGTAINIMILAIILSIYRRKDILMLNNYNI